MSNSTTQYFACSAASGGQLVPQPHKVTISDTLFRELEKMACKRQTSVQKMVERILKERSRHEQRSEDAASAAPRVRDVCL